MEVDSSVPKFLHAVPKVILVFSMLALFERWLKPKSLLLDDYDQWARCVDDEAWSWTEVNRKFNEVGCNIISIGCTI